MLLWLLLLRLASLLRSATASGGGGGNTSCAQESCGNLTIGYPFSLAVAQRLYCGYPAFDLTCDAASASPGRAQAYLSNTFRYRLIRVADVSYENNSLVAAVQTAFDGDHGCPVPDFNVSASLALFPFSISAANSCVFIYGCAVPPELRLRRQCGNRTMGAYISGRWGGGDTLPPGVSRNCTSVSVPVRGEMESELAHRHYERLIADGFQLELPPQLGDCDGCRQMRGECRFEQQSFQCVCPNGNLCPISAQSNSTSHSGSKRNGRKIILIVLPSAAAVLLFPCIYVLIWHRKGKTL